MNRNLIALVIPLVLQQSCSNPMTEEQKIKMLEGQKLEILADLHRHQAECQAQAIEFSNVKGGESIVRSCFDTYRIMVEAARVSLDNIDKRLAELEQKGR